MKLLLAIGAAVALSLAPAVAAADEFVAPSVSLRIPCAVGNIVGIVATDATGTAGCFVNPDAFALPKPALPSSDEDADDEDDD